MQLQKVRFTWLIEPLKRFINNSAFSGILLLSATCLAMLIANSPWAEAFHHFWEIEFAIGTENFLLKQSLHHWINDGLMSIFFFVVGLELKREFIAGELRNPKNAIMPIIAATCGMIFPALIYLFFNSEPSTQKGWGIPTATDIAFALGVLYLLGDRVPTVLKVFLTTIAIVDDLGAVLVIAIFYTSEININSLITAGIFLFVLIVANRLGVRKTWFYGVIGIVGIWASFSMSGVHPTISAVLLAFTIPARTSIDEEKYLYKMNYLIEEFKKAQTTQLPVVTHEQIEIVEKMREVGKVFLPPLQRLEYILHPWVAYVVMPIFALSNAGVAISQESLQYFSSNVTLGIVLGLIAGKFFGICGVSWLLHRFKLVRLHPEITLLHLIGVGFLSAIGFTMSLFIAELASQESSFLVQAKIGILFASFIAGIVGYMIMRRAVKNRS